METSLWLVDGVGGNSTISFDNMSLDIMRKGCFNYFETVACVRNGILTSLGILTGLMSLFTVFHLHLYHHRNFHQYAIFYLSSAESILASVHWLVNMYPQLDFVLQYLKLTQILIMGHFYWTMATRILRKESITKQVVTPLLILALIYFTIIITLAIVNSKSFWIECIQPYWLELSLAELIIVQMFLVAGFYITRRLNEISTLDYIRWQQKRDLWCIIIVFEMSAVVCFTYDLILLIVGDIQHGCSAIFFHMQQLYAPIFIVFMIIKLLLPIWTMLYVFRPIPPSPDHACLLPVPYLSEDGAITPTVDDNQYRQLYQPGCYYQSTDCSPVATLIPSYPTLDQIPEECASKAAASKYPEGSMGEDVTRHKRSNLVINESLSDIGCGSSSDHSYTNSAFADTPAVKPTSLKGKVKTAVITNRQVSTNDLLEVKDGACFV